jgi:hypothetical protein
MESISLTGGPDAGWLAAIAEWFLDLKVKTVDDQSQETLYRNHADDRDTQVTVTYLSQYMQDTVRPCYSDPWHNDNLNIAIILAPPLSVPTKYNDILGITIYRYLLHSFGETIAIRRCHAT